MLLNAYRDLLAAATVGAAYTSYNNANARICVGNSTTAAAAGQTDLQGASKTKKAMDATFPTQVANVLTFRSTFGTGDGNHVWDEWGVDNGGTALVLMNRKVEALGTKSALETKQVTATITLAIA